MSARKAHDTNVMHVCRIAIIIELAITNWIDAAILFVIQMTNATIGWYETMKAGHAVEALKVCLLPYTVVLQWKFAIRCAAALEQ